MEANILNPTTGHALHPDWAYNVTDQVTLDTFRPRRGPRYSRRLSEGGRVYELVWNKRPIATKLLLKQWAAQFEQDFFTYYDAEEGRYFSGYFEEGSMSAVAQAYQNWNIKARFVEEPGRPMYEYPTDWANWAIFQQETNSLGNTMPLLTGAWVLAGNAHAVGGNELRSSTLDDKAELKYYGYGFRYWARKALDLGIVEIFLSQDAGKANYVSLGNVDLYAAADADAAALLTKADVPLGEHRVKVRITHTKNGASAGYAGILDAIEVMR
jgi:hypothetical protein